MSAAKLADSDGGRAIVITDAALPERPSLSGPSPVKNAIDQLLSLHPGARFRFKRRNYAILRGCTTQYPAGSADGERAFFSVIKNNGNSTAIIVRPNDVVELHPQPTQEPSADRQDAGDAQKRAKKLKQTPRHLEVERRVGVLTVSEGGFMRRTTVRRAPNRWATSRKMTPDERAEYGGPRRPPAERRRQLSEYAVDDVINPGRPCVDRPATPQEIEAGRRLAIELRERYNVRRTLVVAAEAGLHHRAPSSMHARSVVAKLPNPGPCSRSMSATCRSSSGVSARRLRLDPVAKCQGALRAECSDASGQARSGRLRRRTREMSRKGSTARTDAVSWR